MALELQDVRCSHFEYYNPPTFCYCPVVFLKILIAEVYDSNNDNCSYLAANLHKDYHQGYIRCCYLVHNG